MRQDKTQVGTQQALYETFKEHLGELYWLAFLLTADRERSMRAFTNALELAGRNPVFRGSELSRARRLIVVAALATIALDLRESALRTERFKEWDCSQFDGLPVHTWVDVLTTKWELERAALALDVFPRCALLLTVFEGLRMEEAALLLNVDAALIRAAQGLGSLELTRNLALGRGWDPAHGMPNPGWRELRHASTGI